MTKIGCLSDIHATRRPPGQCTESYWPDLLDLLRQAARLAGVRKLDAVVLAGDIFHLKGPARTGHDVVQDLLRVLSSFPCRVLGVPGNHDMQHDRIESVRAGQPLGVLFESGVLEELGGWAGGNLPLYGVPWLQKWSAETISDVAAEFRERVFSRTLIATHAPIYPPGKENPYECTPASWWADAFEDGSMGHGLFYGHVHEPHGVYEVAGTRFCNNGALSRGSLDEYNLERQVGMTVWDQGTGGFEFVPLKARPASEVFKLEQAAADKTRKADITEFLEDVGQVQLPRLNEHSVLARLRDMDLPDGGLTLAEELLELARSKK